MRYGAEAATDVELEAAFFHAVDGLNHADAAHVVHIGQAAGLVFAAGEGDLEFAAEVLTVGVPKQETHNGLRIRRDIEGLRAADSGEGAGGDIAHRITAGLAGGDADCRETSHKVGRVFNMDKVDLKILAGRDV